MKNNLSKILIFGFILILIIYLSLGFRNYVQLFNTECGSAFHGIIDEDKHCYNDILITSLPEDNYGTIIRSRISSSGNLRITPGTSSVKILPPLNTDLTIKTGRSKIGGNEGDTGDGKVNNNLKQPSYKITNQNLIISNLDGSIVFYAIYDFYYGTPITEVNNTLITNGTIPINHLQNGIYIIKIQLENGTVFSKTLMIQ